MHVCLKAGATASLDLVDDAIQEGAVQTRAPEGDGSGGDPGRPAPIVWDGGTGSEAMSRIAAPIFSGMVTAPWLSLFVVPAVCALIRQPHGP